jgi:hypothetical protein
LTGASPTSIGEPTSSAFVMEICWIESSSWFTTQIAPGATAIPHGLRPTGIRAVTVRAPALTRVTVRASKFDTQSAPPASTA